MTIVVHGWSAPIWGSASYTELARTLAVVVAYAIVFGALVVAALTVLYRKYVGLKHDVQAKMGVFESIRKDVAAAAHAASVYVAPASMRNAAEKAVKKALDEMSETGGGEFDESAELTGKASLVRLMREVADKAIEEASLSGDLTRLLENALPYLRLTWVERMTPKREDEDGESVETGE